MLIKTVIVKSYGREHLLKNLKYVTLMFIS